MIQLFVLIVTHPLEPINMNDYNISMDLRLFVCDDYYVSPDNGFIKEVVLSNSLYQVTLSLNDMSEIVFSGLTEFYGSKGKQVYKGDKIGRDTTISRNTKYILMLYKNSMIFPQFSNKKLLFNIDKGTPVYAMADSYVIGQGFFPENYGLITQNKLITKESLIINFMHLQNIYTQLNSTISQGELIAMSGNTGDSLEPCLELRFDDADLKEDIRVVYLNPNP
jgi:hypothetical protein